MQTTARRDTPATLTTAGQPLEVLAFALGPEEYAVDIQRVQELRGYEHVTRIPGTPPHVPGVVNLRGAIVPIVDMRLKFRLGAASYNQFTVVIVVNVRGRIAGMVVDSVSDVIALGPGDIKPPPKLGSAVDTEYLVGLGTVSERMLIQLDLDKLLSTDDIPLREEVTA